MISVVIPTITGREWWLKQCLDEYQRQSPKDTEFIVIKDEPSCGHAWIKGAEQAQGKYLHFTADDITPMRYWWPDAIYQLKAGKVPCAEVFNKSGDSVTPMSPLGDLGLVPNVLVPFLSREMLEAAPGWLPDFHYGSDDWISYWAVTHGYPLEKVPNYKFVHYAASQGRNMLRRHGDVKKLVDAMEAAGYVPPAYADLEVNLRDSPTGYATSTNKRLEALARRQARRARRAR